jgi:hypothetical protein
MLSPGLLSLREARRRRFLSDLPAIRQRNPRKLYLIVLLDYYIHIIISEIQNQCSCKVNIHVHNVRWVYLLVYNMLDSFNCKNYNGA